jgi:lipopolysaccharide export system protein LptA
MKHFIKPFGFIFVVTLCTAILSIVSAQSTGLKGMMADDSSAETPFTQILSNSLSYDDLTKQSTFVGQVVMTRGLLTMHADTLKLREDSEGFQHGTALANEGRRIYIRQEKPETFEVMQGLGESAEYDGKAQTFELIGRAILTRFICGKPFDNISGDRVKYSEKTEMYQAFGGSKSDNPGGQVRSIAQPRAKVDAAVESCRQLQASGGTIPTVPSPTQ